MSVIRNAVRLLLPGACTQPIVVKPPAVSVTPARSLLARTIIRAVNEGSIDKLELLLDSKTAQIIRESVTGLTPRARYRLINCYLPYHLNAAISNCKSDWSDLNLTVGKAILAAFLHAEIPLQQSGSATNTAACDKRAGQAAL